MWLPACWPAPSAPHAREDIWQCEDCPPLLRCVMLWRGRVVGCSRVRRVPECLPRHFACQLLAICPAHAFASIHCPVLSPCASCWAACHAASLTFTGAPAQPEGGPRHPSLAPPCTAHQRQDHAIQTKITRKQGRRCPPRHRSRLTSHACGWRRWHWPPPFPPHTQLLSGAAGPQHAPPSQPRAVPASWLQAGRTRCTAWSASGHCTPPAPRAFSPPRHGWHHPRA